MAIQAIPIVGLERSNIAFVARVAVGPAAVTLRPENLSRIKTIIFNETGTLKIKLGAGITATDYSHEIIATPGNNLVSVDNYTGVITALKSSGNSFVQVTEISAQAVIA